MRTRHIEVFNSIYKTGSVTSAAKHLNVSQPSVSKVLAHAEQQLGFALFERIRMRLVPTPEANILFKHTAVMESVLTDINQISESLTEFPKDRLRLSCTPSLGIDYLPKAIAIFKKKNPHVSFEISTLQYSELKNKIMDTSIDIAISQDQKEDKDIGVLNLTKGLFVIVKSENNKNKNLKSIPFIKLSSISPLGKKLDKYIQENNMVLESSITSDNYQMAASMVINGFGYSILDEFTAKVSQSRGITISTLKPKLEFSIDLMYLKEKPLSIMTKKFMEFISDFNYTV
jgi:DNA-binding transcriptional LysR family regulator|tara:strand:- start:1208 stop:2068 length:861 start_codon:yes stop_codon:yes gene_type:complete